MAHTLPVNISIFGYGILIVNSGDSNFTIYVVMEIKHLHSHNDLIKSTGNLDKAYILLYKKGSDSSECSVKSIEEASRKHEKQHVYMVDVNEVRDIHPVYSIKTVPSLLVFEKGEYKNVIKGCNDVGFYSSVFDNIIYSATSDEVGQSQKRVTVYSTPACSWCTTLKTHLRKNGIRFTDIDVSRDQAQAEELVRRSGQQGVPQTDIDGEIIVGFDKNRINKLLGIN